LRIKLLEFLQCLFLNAVEDDNDVWIEEVLLEERKRFFAVRPSAHDESTSHRRYPLVLAAPDLHSVSMSASSVYFESALF
jgi:hypothetical protein